MASFGEEVDDGTHHHRHQSEEDASTTVVVVGGDATHTQTHTHSHSHSHNGVSDEEHSHEHEHTHRHSHNHDGETTEEHAHVHSHTHAPISLEGEEHAHSHHHDEGEVDVSGLREHVDESRAAKEEDDAGPADRYVTPADATEFSLEDAEIHYAGTSGLKVTVLDGVDKMKRLTRLTLRSCLIADMSPIAANGATLTYLELYDNQLRSLRGVEACPHLVVLDVSYNVVRSAAPVAVCSKLEECYIAANKLRTIDGLENLDNLRKLDLGANRIRSTVGVPNGGNSSLQHLFLGKNRIERIEALPLNTLRILDVQSNRLTSLEGAFVETTSKASLSELYLANNAIGPDLVPQHLVALAESLDTIDLSHNRLTTLHPLSVLTKLQDLWLSYNAVTDLDSVLAIRHLPLTCIYLEHNPCANDDRYLSFLRNLFSDTLTQVDAVCYPLLGSTESREE